jgi:hypothetical protein
MGVPGGLGAGYGGNRPEPPLRCRRLAAPIEAWGKIPHHNRYVRDQLRAYDHLLVEEALGPAAGSGQCSSDCVNDRTGMEKGVGALETTEMISGRSIWKAIGVLRGDAEGVEDPQPLLQIGHGLGQARSRLRRQIQIGSGLLQPVGAAGWLAVDRPTGEVLLEEVLRPMGISRYRLALAIGGS